MPPVTPVFREMSHDECESLLRAHAHGRLAFTFHDRVDIEPIHYIYDEGWIVGRTGAGTKLTVLTHHPWVAFEVDEVESAFSWRSVVAKGTVYSLAEDGVAPDAPARLHAIELLRRVFPAAFTEDDPLPTRTFLFRIHVDELTGRASETGTP
jgi:nitroimidazol reductase NimA-like FMN-containing flavoprotein (pyridoxamine 5'-phosphate oxidase superfamily)